MGPPQTSGLSPGDTTITSLLPSRLVGRQNSITDSIAYRTGGRTLALKSLLVSG